MQPRARLGVHACMMPTAAIRLLEKPWNSYFTGNGLHRDRWVGKSYAKTREVWLRNGIRALRRIPVLRRIALRVNAHELAHLMYAWFSKNEDHHDDQRWVDSAPEGETRKLHECGLSYSIKPDDAKPTGGLPWWLSPRALWSARRWFSLKHIPPEVVAYAKTLLRHGHVIVPYEEGSGLWLAIEAQRAG